MPLSPEDRRRTLVAVLAEALLGLQGAQVSRTRESDPVKPALENSDGSKL